MRCKDTKLFLINNHKDHNLRFLEQVGSLTDGQRVRSISLIKKGLTELRTLWLAGSISESKTLPEWDADDRPKW
jgi:hypothetical protein